MNRYTTLAFISIFIAGCAGTPYVRLIDTSLPSLNEETTVYLGDSMLKQASGYYADTLTLGAASGIMSDISAGAYCRREEGSNKFYSFDDHAITLKTAFGQIVGYENYVTYDKNSNTACPGGSNPYRGCYNSDEIAIKFTEKSFCQTQNSIQQIIEYNGKSGNIINFTYREFSLGNARPAFTTNFTMDVSEGNTISYKGARLEVVSATNNNITYKVIKNFNTN